MSSPSHSILDSTESDPEPSHARRSSNPLRQKLQWLIFVRFLIATFLFGSSVAVEMSDGGRFEFVPPVYALIAAIMVATVTYAAVLPRVKRLTLFAGIQLFIDCLFVTPVIYATGTHSSPFSFLYILVIISSSYLLYRPGAFFGATISALCYSGLMALIRFYPEWQPAGFVDAARDLPDKTIFLEVMLNVFAFYLVAFLSSSLAEQLKRADEALQEEQQSLRELEEINNKIVNNTDNGIITLDRHQRITFLNPAAQEVTGVDATEVLGMHIDELFPDASRYLPLNSGDASKAPRGRGRWQMNYQRSDNQVLYLGISTLNVQNTEGENAGFMLIFEDESKLKQLEEKARRDDRLKAVGRLAAGIAHEIRNPLASISGSIQILREDSRMEDDNKRLMDIVIRETDRLNSLITDFLHYVRPSPSNRSTVDLEALIKDVVTQVEVNPKFQKRHEIKLDLCSTPSVTADPGQLSQVLWNLILNALESMPEGGRITIGTKMAKDGEAPFDQAVILSVSDTGPGIEPSIRERLFDPFFSTKVEGTGLGLAQVEKIVQNHDGMIRAKNNADVGATFEIILPIGIPRIVVKKEQDIESQPEESERNHV